MKNIISRLFVCRLILNCLAQVRYLKCHGARGVMLYGVDFDDYKNYCNIKPPKYPLNSAAIEEIQSDDWRICATNFS